MPVRLRLPLAFDAALVPPRGGPRAGLPRIAAAGWDIIAGGMPGAETVNYYFRAAARIMELSAA